MYWAIGLWRIFLEESLEDFLSRVDGFFYQPARSYTARFRRQGTTREKSQGYKLVPRGEVAADGAP